MIAEQLVEKGMCKQNGKPAVQGIEASLKQEESSRVTYENGKLKSVTTTQDTNIGVRVIVDGKVGSSYTTDPEDLDGVVQRALDAAEFGSLAHFTFPGPQPAGEVKVYDPSIQGVTLAAMVESGQAMIERIRAYNPEILTNAVVNKGVGRVEFANSSGACFQDENTAYSISAEGQLVRGTDILFAGDGQYQRNLAGEPLDIADKVISWFRLAERNAAIPSGEMPVIFTPEGLSVLLLSLALALDGKNVFLGESPLKEKVGAQVASPAFTLVDHPLVDYAYGSSRYDGEGVPHQVTPLIEQGVLRGFLYDLDTAGRAETLSTGHGPGCQATNWLVQPGNIAYADMLRSVRSGLLVHSVMGLGQGNPISGEFSVNVQLGYRIENGEIVGRVKDVMLAGNAYDALKDITAISSEQKWVGLFSGPAHLPYIQVGKLSVVAK